VRHAVERLVTLLKDYRATLRRTISVSFVDEWREVRDEYAPALASQGVVLEERFPPGIEVARIHLRSGEFRHIFENCFDNSLRAMWESAEKKITVSASMDSGVHFEVRWDDTGCGIPKPLAARLFNEVVPSASPDGKGEGCFISSQIVRRRHGAIRCEWQPKGEGASIFMKFIRSR
jgi:C4-dicarboxylate-specific signal transduction histidine kinase